jgi:dolichol-phosphate mannosyltransferase
MISIILATFNEKENIQDMIDSLTKEIKEPLEIVVVDDNSPDGTADLVAGLKYDHVTLIRRKKTKGLATAFNRGIIESKGDIVGWMDSDMCMPPALVPKMISLLKEYDAVVGSRYVKGAKDTRAPIRTITSTMINGLAGFVLGYGIKDYDSGFIVLKRSVFNEVTLYPKGYGSYFIELLFDIRKKGMTVKEIPYTFNERSKGTSKSFSSWFNLITLGMEYVIRIFKTRLKRTR